MFVMVATNVTVNVSATLIKLLNQFTNIVTELRLIKVVLPPTEPVTDIVQIMSLAQQSGDVDVKVNGVTAWEPAAANQV